MLSIVEPLCDIGVSKTVVVLESDIKQWPNAIEELNSKAAKTAAIQFGASKGMSSPGVSNIPTAFPVDASGNEIKDHTTQKIAAYRTEIALSCRA